MASLGRFGVEHDKGDAETFDYFEHEVRINPGFGELDLADFLEAAAGVDEDSPSEALGLLKSTLRAMVHPEDFDTFWGTAKRERQGVMDLMGLLRAVVEAVAARPTERPSVSSDGPQLTSVPSVGDSSSLVIHQLEQQGRPSIALMVQQQASAATA